MDLSCLQPARQMVEKTSIKQSFIPTTFNHQESKQERTIKNKRTRRGETRCMIRRVTDGAEERMQLHKIHSRKQMANK